MLSFLPVKCCGILSLLLRRESHPSFWVLSCEDNMATIALTTGCSEVFQVESVPSLNCSFPPEMFLTSLSIEQNFTWRHICGFLVIIAVIFSSPLWETDCFWSWRRAMVPGRAHGVTHLCARPRAACSGRSAALTASSPALRRSSRQVKEASGTGCNVCILDCFSSG